MTFSLFTKKVQAALQVYFGNETILDIQKITKNNGIELTGLIIREEECDIATTIYLDCFYSEYENGVSMSETVRRIIKVYEDNRVRKDVDVSFFDSYEQVRKRLSCRLINRELNEKMLSRVPCRVMENLAIVYHCVFISDEFGCASVLIDYSHLRYWRVSEEQIFKDVLENMPRILPIKRIPMKQFLEESVRKMVFFVRPEI